jgi:hypothetical protein
VSWLGAFFEPAVLFLEPVQPGNVVDVPVKERSVGRERDIDDGGIRPGPLLYVGEVLPDERLKLHQQTASVGQRRRLLMDRHGVGSR